MRKYVMEEQLDFSLPVQKSNTSLVPKISVILLLILVGLMLLDLLMPYRRGDRAAHSNLSLSTEDLKELATKLSNRNLYTCAAQVWQDYLLVGDMPDTERVKSLYQIGTLLEKAGSYEEAIEYFYRSEIIAKLPELEPQINMHIKDCFERLGKFSALRYELMDRADFQNTNRAGSKIVAEIGAEKITEVDLDSLIERTIDNQLAPMAAFMTKEQCNEQKKKILEQYKGASAKLEFLQTWLSQEVLYRQALEEKLSQKPKTKRVIEDVVRSVLSQQLMNKELADKINITEIDLHMYYQAHKYNYLEPATAYISHIIVADRQQADDLIDRIKNGEDFGVLAKEFSSDQSTKEKAGAIDVDVREGTYIPGIGEYIQLNDEIFATPAGEVLAEPFQTEKGWEVIKVRERRSQRQKTFDEARQQVMTALLSQKRQDVQNALVKQMMDKFNVILHTSVLKDTGQQGKSGNSTSGS